MIPGPLKARSALAFCIDRSIFPAVEFSILTHGADLDANPARGDPVPVQLGAVNGAGIFIGQALGIVLLVEGAGRTHSNAAHAPNA